MELASAEVTITTSGRRYAIGRDADGHAVVDLDTPGTPAVDHYPPGRDGWNRAWRSFNALERRPDSHAVEPATVAGTWGAPAPDRGTRTAPGAPRPAGELTPAPEETAIPAAAAAAAAIGIVAGVAGLFPTYIGGASLASHTDGLLPHVVYLAGWAAAAALLLAGGRVVRAGAALGTGLGAVTFGLFVADLGTAPGQAAGAVGPGMYLAFAGWLICTAAFTGALVSLLRADRRAPGGRPGVARRVALALRRAGPGGAVGLLVAVGAAVTFAPPWDRYTLSSALSGAHETVTAGNVFANPALAITGDVLAMVAVVAVALYALYAARDAGAIGAGLLAGSILALFAQVVSALAQPAPSPADFGFGGSAAAGAQVAVSAGFTGWFYLYCAFVAAAAAIAGALVIAGRTVHPRAADREHTGPTR